MKHIVLIINMVGLSMYSIAQTLSPEVLTASTGGFGSGSGRNLSWTAGEPIVFTSTPNLHLTQGFHQPRVKCDNIDTSLTASGSETCEGTNAIATITKSTRGFDYQAYIAGLKLGNKSIGNNRELILLLPYQQLQAGGNAVSVTVTKLGCLPKTLLDTATIVKQMAVGKMEDIQSIGTVACDPNHLYLFAEPGFRKYQWIINDTLLIGVDSAKEEVTRAGFYQVIGFLETGCYAESDSFQVTASLLQSPPKPKITKTGGETACDLNSVQLKIEPAFTGYQWRRNLVRIGGATQQIYDVILPGSYSVQVIDDEGCSNYSDGTIVVQTNGVETPRLSGSGDPFMLASSISGEQNDYQWFATWDNTMRKRAIANAPNLPTYRPLYSATYYVQVHYDTCKVMSTSFHVAEQGMPPLQRVAQFMNDSTLYIPDFGSALLEVFPNPAKGSVRVSYHSPTSDGMMCQLLNMEGKRILSASKEFFNGHNEWVFDTKDLSSGIYLVVVTSEEAVSTHKLMLEKE